MKMREVIGSIPVCPLLNRILSSVWFLFFFRREEREEKMKKLSGNAKRPARRLEREKREREEREGPGRIEWR